MQDPNADTEWNDQLRKHGILPAKPKEVEVTEEALLEMMEKTIKEKSGKKDIDEMSLQELNENEDEFDDWEDEKLMEQIRRQRIAEMMEQQSKNKFGDVREISAVDYVDEVNKAGEGIYVVLHLFKSGIPLCDLINSYIDELAKKFPATKFLRSVSTNCIPNYPDKNVPTVFVYYEGDMKAQLMGPHAFGGMRLTKDDLEWMLSKYGCVKTTLKSDPRGTSVENSNGFSMLTRASRGGRKDSTDDDDSD